MARRNLALSVLASLLLAMACPLALAGRVGEAPLAGPAAPKVRMPDLIGLQRSDAREIVLRLGLGYIESPREVDSRPGVIAQSVAAGTYVEQGTNVTVTVRVVRQRGKGR